MDNFEQQSVSSLLSSFEDIINLKNQNLIQENANVDGTSPCGQMNRFASESAKYFARSKILSSEAAKAVNENFIHIHDLDYMAAGTTTCCQIPLGKMLKSGFDTGHGFMRSPKSIMSAMALSAIIFQSNQNQQHGGQSFQAFDYDLAPYVRKTYDRRLKKLMEYRLPLEGRELESLAWKETEEETYQACEAFIHNLKNLHSRSGGQVPFTSINYGTDTSKEGHPDSEVAYMGCRTRIMSNVNGEENSVSRGNLSFTSINLVKIALVTREIDEFMKKLEKYADIVIRQLYDRYLYQAGKKAGHFTFLYGQNVWKNSQNLIQSDTLQSVLKEGSLSIGFIGLAECLKVLTGKHHGESEEAQILGQRIAAVLKRKCTDASEAYHLNYSLIGTPAEGLSGRFTKKDKEIFGCIPGVTDREYYTNSFHIPVYYHLHAAEKIKREAVYHSYTDAGHITYIEVDGDVSKNLAAMDTIIKKMAAEGIGYGSINHPVDRCIHCGYTGIIDNECPDCHTTDEQNIDRIRRITGYLVGTMDKWNTAKAAEEKDRVKHI